jgi:hypothetical protein
MTYTCTVRMKIVHFDLGIIWEDVTAYVIAAESRIGFSGEMQHTADIGQLFLTLDNSDQRFSPEYTPSPYYGYLRPSAPVEVKISDGVTTWYVFKGIIRSIDPDAGVNGSKQCTVLCEDLLTMYQPAFAFSLPIQTNIRADELILKIANQIHDVDPWAALIIYLENPSAGNKISFTTPQSGTVTYTYRNSLSAAGDVLLGADLIESCSNMFDAMNGNAVNSGITYHGSTKPITADMSITYFDDALTFLALTPGTWANIIAYTITGFNTFNGDVPASDYSPVDLQTGDRVFTFAADLWDENSNGMQAVNDCAASEYGFVWFSRNGTLTFKNRRWEPELTSATPTATINGTHTGQRGEMSISRLQNKITITHIPRSQVGIGVVAHSFAPIMVPSKSFVSSDSALWPRTNRDAQGYVGSSGSGVPRAGDKMIRLPYTDEYGNPVSAKDIIQPVITTDFTINTREDGTGQTFSNAQKRIEISLAPGSSDVEVAFKNTHSMEVYIQNFQIRGTQIRHYSPETALYADSYSVYLYGLKVYNHDLAFGSGDVFTEALGFYLLYRYKTPLYVIDTIAFEGPALIGAVNLAALEIGDTLSISETQTAVDAQKYVIRSIETTLGQGGDVVNFTFGVKRLNPANFWVLGDATLGILGSTTRLAL